jgi:MFS family permease
MNGHIPTSKQWWWHNRLRYNKGLIIAGFIAFMLYCILGPIIIAPHEEFEETIFEMAFQGTAYFIMMLIANAFYTLGWLIDILANKSNSQLLRQRLFALGYWFSFALPILIILSVMARFLIWGK